MTAEHCDRGPDVCFGCKVRTIQFNPYSMPNRLHPENRPKREPDSYARGIYRWADGTPVHRPDGSVIGLREPASAVQREIRARAEAARAGVTVDQPRDRVTVSTSKER